MSILIHGMEMPHQGEFKHIRIYDNGEVTVQVDTGKEVYEAVIAHAVQLPPHGDLIDRDKLETHHGWYNEDRERNVVQTHIQFVYVGFTELIQT